MPLLSPGDSFPALSLTPPGSPALTLPDASRKGDRSGNRLCR